MENPEHPPPAARGEPETPPRPLVQREWERRCHALVENVLDMIAVVDRAGTVRYDSPSVEWVLGYRPGEKTGKSIFEFVAPDDVPGLREEFDRVFERPGSLFRTEFRARHKDGTWRLVECVGKNLVDDPDVNGIILTARDVTQRKQVEQAHALKEATSQALLESLDEVEALRKMGGIVVERFATLCIYHLLDERRALRLAVVAGRDTSQEELARDAERGLRDERGVLNEILVSGKGELVPEVTEAWLTRAVGADPESLRAFRRLGPRSVIVTPIGCRGRPIGACTHVSTDPSRRFEDFDLWIAEDLALRAALQVDNLRLYEAAQAADEAKSDFLAIMSHELRTPLTAVIGYTDMLATGMSGPVTDRQREQLGRVQTSAGHLLRMIDDILDYSRMEAGREKVEPQRVDLGALIGEVAEIIEPEAREKGLDFRTRLPEAPRSVEIDAGKVRQHLLGLLSNAVRFTEEGEVELEVVPGPDTITFRIRDTGIGIAPEHHERIFEPFWQVEPTLTRERGGTGLGLTVARRIARLLGGDITVESALDEGSTFTVTLPTGGGRGPATPGRSAIDTKGAA